MPKGGGKDVSPPGAYLQYNEVRSLVTETPQTFDLTAPSSTSSIPQTRSGYDICCRSASTKTVECMSLCFDYVTRCSPGIKYSLELFLFISFGFVSVYRPVTYISANDILISLSSKRHSRCSWLGHMRELTQLH
jgi:hypothetical protein